MPNDHLSSKGCALGNRHAGGGGEFSLGRVTTLLLLGRVVGYVLALGNSVILARTLGVDRLGIYAYATGIAALLDSCRTWGSALLLPVPLPRTQEQGLG